MYTPKLALIFVIGTLGACEGPRVDDESPTRPEQPEPPEPPTARTYCETIVEFFCPYYVRCGRMAVTSVDECTPVFLEACNERYEPSYVALEDAGLIEISSDGVTQCRAHLEDVACEEQILDLDGGCASMWTGQVDVGGACGFDVESFVCAPGAVCTVGLDLCGTCETVLEDGAACGAVNTSCSRTSSCEDGVCVPKKPVGAACAPDDRCVLGAACRDGVCAGPDYVSVGDTCDFDRRCPYASACIDGVCVRSSELEGPCGAERACDSGFCSDGVCVPFVAQGAPCSASPQCQTGACIEGFCLEVGVCSEAAP